MKAPRCDSTEAWAALAGHFEAHGRAFDLREAFARDPGRFKSLSVEAPERFIWLGRTADARLASLRIDFPAIQRWDSPTPLVLP